MASLNKVFLIGNLTRDPDARRTPTGTPVTDLRLAVNRKYRTADGRDVDETCYVDVTVWGRQAETAGEYLRKGSAVLVEGRLHLREWTNKDNQKVSRLSVVAERIQFLGSPRRAEFADAPPEMEESPTPSEGTAEMDAEPDEGATADDENLPF